jgi:aminocarboxymuconate-semialdehyde decarboxylase
MKIDLHTHILPHSLPDLRERYGYGGFMSMEHHAPCRARMLIDGRFFREVSDNSWDPIRRIEECDADGVSVQALSTVPVMFSYWAKPQHAADLSQLLNDNIAETVAAHPRRFVGFGTLPMQGAELAVRELERCVKKLGFPGVQIGSHVNRMNLDAPELFPVFEAAQELGAAVFVHPWDMLGKERMPRYWLPWLVGMPAETTLAICAVIFGGILERLPRLRICFAHGGGNFPGTIGRIEHGFKVRPDLVAVENPVNPREYLGRFYVDSLVHDEDALRLLLKLMTPDRVAMGSDYPFPLGERPAGRLIESLLDLSPAIKDRLLAGTALEFLNVPRERFE